MLERIHYVSLKNHPSSQEATAFTKAIKMVLGLGRQHRDKPSDGCPLQAGVDSRRHCHGTGHAVISGDNGIPEWQGPCIITCQRQGG